MTFKYIKKLQLYKNKILLLEKNIKTIKIIYDI